MDNWDELRTAYEVARHGTVSGAATKLGVHHATVIRHVDALEDRLGVRLFQRHARGYTPTEAGLDLARVAQATDDQFSQLAARLSGQGDLVSGELVITTLASFSGLLMPALASFSEAYPEVRLVYRAGTRLFRLEYGEAHVAIRAGQPPREPDNVVQKLLDLKFALVAAPDYVARRGTPTAQNYMEHDFVASDNATPRAPTLKWIADTIPAARHVFRVNDDVSYGNAVRRGMGIGFLPEEEAHSGAFTVVMPTREDWNVSLWLVTHVDLHRSAKVQALTKHLKTHLS
ncbi:MAG: LysR family transcriptional regulator [Maritimibacter sp.]